MAIAEANGTWFRDRSRKVYADVAAGKRSLPPLPVKRVVDKYRKSLGETNNLRAVLEKLSIGPFEIYYEDLYRGERKTRLAALGHLFNFLDIAPETIEKHHRDIEAKIFNGGQDTARVLDTCPTLAR